MACRIVLRADLCFEQYVVVVGLFSVLLFRLLFIAVMVLHVMLRGRVCHFL